MYIDNHIDPQGNQHEPNAPPNSSSHWCATVCISQFSQQELEQAGFQVKGYK